MITNIDELKLSHNTILVFMTDNGTASGDVIYNGGLRGRKSSEYEGGHRVPLMIRWQSFNILLIE